MAKAYQVRQVIKAIEKLSWLEVTDHYTYRITWSPEDGEHLGLCAEFPSLSWLASTPSDALSGIQELVSSVLADMQVNGESHRSPWRIVPTVEGSCAATARNTPRPRDQGFGSSVSLNRLVSARLAG